MGLRAQIVRVLIISHLISAEYRHRAWRHDLTTLREQIHRDGSLQVGMSKEEVVEQLRQTRREIFEAAYAHLYR